MSTEKKTIAQLIEMCQNELSPREDRVIIFQDAANTQTKGGLYLPEISIHKPSKGTVMVVGPGLHGQETKMTDLAAGDHVLYGKFAGVDIEWDEEIFVVVRQTDIILVEKKKAIVQA